MIAKFGLALPFWIAVPEGIELKLYTYEDEGFLVTVYPPTPSDSPPNQSKPDEVTIDGKAAFLANALNVEFRRDTFNRVSGGEPDPPETVINRAVESFMSRLRYVTRGSQVRFKTFALPPWRVRYFNDDGSELPQQEGFIRGRAAKTVSVSLVSINNDVWDSIHTLDPDWRSPTWDDLLLDAVDSLPHVGSAVVLAATSLEVFIEYVLNRLADHHKFSPSLWAWLNDRQNWLKDPSVEEQFDDLLKHFTGISLKDNSTLWESFKKLKGARNTFVHRGVAEVGKKALLPQEANALIGKASEIIAWVREILPEEIRWPVFQPNIKTETFMTIIKPSEEKEAIPSDGDTSPSSHT
jgi:hypothetical protein